MTVLRKLLRASVYCCPALWSLSAARAAETPPTVIAVVTGTTGACPSATTAKSVFSTSDAVAWFDVDYSGGYAGDTFNVEWIEPNGNVYATASLTQTATGGGYCNWYPLSISGNPPAGITGIWTAKLIWNTTQITYAQFTISGAGTPISLSANVV